MLTEEQIKNLKLGDPVIINATFDHVDEEGDIWVKRKFYDSYYWVSHYCVSLPSEHGTSVPTPKYDPCRLFRKGDIVRLKEWNGRCPALPEDWKLDNGLFKVHEDEKFNSSVEITRENSKTVYIAPICFIELVTPVEALEPYTQGKGIDEQNIYKNGDLYAELKDAKEAEIVCKLLNAEYRKEQSNDK